MNVLKVSTKIEIKQYFVGNVIKSVDEAKTLEQAKEKLAIHRYQNPGNIYRIVSTTETVYSL